MAVTMREPREEPRHLTILGSTGSVGCNTIDLIERNPGTYVIEALTANRNVKLLAEQALRLRPRMAVVADHDGYDELKTALEGTDIQVASGAESLVEAALLPADWVMAGIVGAVGLEPTLASLRRGAVVGLANKECLVCAGDIVMAEIERSGATLLPVDSEHSAIFQVFDFEQIDRVDRIILTCSGGPFRARRPEDMKDVTPSEAVAHPNWDMGAKISVDSATMMNKGLEVIEASHLFPLDEDRIEIVIHPQSVVHSMVEYVDGSVLAQLGTPDMRTPIAYALGWPARIPAPAERLDFSTLSALTFEAPDSERFPALRLAREALQMGGSAPTILNAANEVAVHGFLEERTGFLDIARIVERTLERLPHCSVETLEDVRDVDTEARRFAAEVLNAEFRKN